MRSAQRIVSLNFFGSGDHWKAQCGEESHAAFGEGPMEKDCSRSTSPAAYSTWEGGDGKGLHLHDLASALLHS